MSRDYDPRRDNFALDAPRIQAAIGLLAQKQTPDRLLDRTGACEMELMGAGKTAPKIRS
ncbi:MAG: hypothetical protein PHW25_00065 [Zoogloea sp.]|jgi:hypothetical protein|nr:hypothetical protein [Zoogloea sp.]